MSDGLSLLVVDVSEAFEEMLKATEREYLVDWDGISPGAYKEKELYRDPIFERMHYPYGSLRSGLNAIVDTTRIARERGIPVYAVHYYTGNSDGEEQTCLSLQPYISEKNRYEKHVPSAFGCQLANRLEADDCRHLMVIGYDRDDCVMATVKDAVARGITVVTSEHCMLTQNLRDRRASSLVYFQENTVFLGKLVDVWNYIRSATVPSSF